MDSSVKTLARALLIGAVAVAWLAVAGAAPAGQKAPAGRQTASATPKAPAQAPPAAAQAAGNFVGEETCLGCHETQKEYKTTAHGRAFDKATPAATHGCESCHGPGEEHASGGGDKTKIKTFEKTMSAKEINAQCESCHAKGERALWEGSAHDARGLSCVTCHSVHSAKAEQGLLKTTAQTETCAQCHRDKAQKVRRSAHMPVSEGKMECSSCHNPHGSQNVKLLKTGYSVNEACTSCHAEKRGPFLFDHAAVENSCTSCHDAHGSNNERMLTQKQPFLCQRCHVTSRHPPTIYEGYTLRTSTNANKIYGRSCVSCHQNIHGSNHPSGKAFLR